jgi:hypothetical protein
MTADQIFNRYTTDREFRMDVHRSPKTAKAIGKRDINDVYEIRWDGQKLIVRHNKNGSYTQIF